MYIKYKVLKKILYYIIMSTEIIKKNNKNINNLFNTFKSIMNSKYDTFKLLSLKNFLEPKLGNIGYTSKYKKDLLDTLCNHKDILFKNDGNLNKTTIKSIITNILNKFFKNNSNINSNKTIGIVLGEVKKKNITEKIILLCKNDINHIIKTIEFLLENIGISATGFCGSISGKTKINLGNHFCLTVPNDGKGIIIRLSDKSNKSVYTLTQHENGYKAMGGKIQYGGELVFIILFVVISLICAFVGMSNPVVD
jgi:hypothetical protein